MNKIRTQVTCGATAIGKYVKIFEFEGRGGGEEGLGDVFNYIIFQSNLNSD